MKRFIIGIVANQTAGAKRLNITASNFMGGVSIKN